MMDLVSIKVGVIFGLLFLTFVAACLPLIFILPFLGGRSEYIRSSASSTKLSQSLQRVLPCLTRKRRRDGKLSTSTEFHEENDTDGEKGEEEKTKGGKTALFLDIMNCFSGGVFLGTSFLALMPEIREIFDEVGIMWPKFSSPSLNATDSSVEEHGEGVLLPVTEILVTCGLFLILCLEQVVHSIMDHKHAPKKKEPVIAEHMNGEAEVVVNGGLGERVNIKVTAATPLNETLETEVVFSDDLVVDILHPPSDKKELEKEEHAHIHEDEHTDSIVRSLILVFTLSMHSLLEGLAIGLQDQASSILSIFVAVLFHKSLMSFSMGNNLVIAGQSIRSIVIAAAVTSTASPMGITVGIIMKGGGDGTKIINGVLQGIATGTFLFITFFEVLAKEFGNHSNRVFKTLAFIFGYCTILAVMFAQHAG